jgi:hypothetical protein
MCATPLLLNLYFMLMPVFRGSQVPQVRDMMLLTMNYPAGDER